MPLSSFESIGARPCGLLLLICVLASTGLIACGGSAEPTDDTGGTNAAGGSRRANDFSRFGGTIVTDLRPIVYKNLDGGLLAPPLPLADGRQLVLTDNRRLSLALRDSVIWTFAYPEGEHPLPVVAADSMGTIYTVSTRGALRAIAPDGRSRWTAALGAGDDTTRFIACSFPLAMADGVVVGDSEGRLIRYTNDGKIRWQIRRGAAIAQMFAASPSLGIVAAVTHNDYSLSDTVVAIDPTNGRQRWASPVAGGRILVGPAIVQGTIAVGAATRLAGGDRAPFIAAFASDGRQAWRASLPVLPRGLAGDGEGNIYASGSSVGREFTGGAVLSFNPAGTLRWSAAFESGIPAAVAVGGDYIYFVARRNGTTGVYTYGHDGVFKAFVAVSLLPDVLSQAAVSSYGDLLLGAMQQPMILEGDDAR